MKKLDKFKAREIRERFLKGAKQTFLAKEYAVSAASISKIISNLTHFDCAYEPANCRKPLDIEYCRFLKSQGRSCGEISVMEAVHSQRLVPKSFETIRIALKKAESEGGNQ